MSTEKTPDNVEKEALILRRKKYCSQLDELRGSTRFEREEGTDFAVIYRETGEAILVDVHDESLTGIGILVDSDLDLRVGSHVHVIYAHEYLEGKVRHITSQPCGRYIIGLSCQRLLPRKTE